MAQNVVSVSVLEGTKVLSVPAKSGWLIFLLISIYLFSHFREDVSGVPSPVSLTVFRCVCLEPCSEAAPTPEPLHSHLMLWEHPLF